MESTLYERYLHSSAAKSLMTLDAFRIILRQMHSKGFIAPLVLHGAKAYQLLLADGNHGLSIHPEAPLEEMRLAIGSRRSKHVVPGQSVQRVTQDTISASEALGADVIRTLDVLLTEKGLGVDFRRHMIARHIQKMQASLMNSPESLMDYVRTNTPTVLELTRSALRARGTEFVLLSLRLAEVQMRAYG